MILPSMTEEQILQILVDDYKQIKKSTRSSAQKQIKTQGYNKLKGTFFSLKISLINGDKWFVYIVYEKLGNALWHSVSFCEVESDLGSKDYYLVRNVNKKPYFLKLTSHAVKRIRERSLHNKDFTPEEVVMSFFCNPETGVATRYYSVKESMQLYKFDDLESLDDNGFFIMFFNGLFLGYKTKNGNWLLQTHISWELAASHCIQSKNLSMDDTQGSLTWVLNHIHRYFNKKLWEDSSREEGEEIVDSETFAGVEWSRESDKYFLLEQ